MTCTGASQVSNLDPNHLAALKGLTSLTYGENEVGEEVINAIAELTRLQNLRLTSPSSFCNGDLQRLSALTSLTSLDVATCRAGRL